MMENSFQCFVQILVLGRSGPNVAEQFGGQHEKALDGHHIRPCLLCHIVRELGIVEVGVACGDLIGVYVLRKVFRDIAVEHRAKHIALEIPAIYAAPQFVCNGPDRPVEFLAFLLFLYVSHRGFLLAF